MGAHHQREGSPGHLKKDAAGAGTQRLRRSLLYVPGNMPSMLQNIPIFAADSVIIDLEDAVPLGEKDAARRLVRRFLETYQDRRQEVLVRINALDTEWGRDDLAEVLPALPDGIRLPKADTPEIVERLDTLLTEHEEALGLEVGRFRVLPSIESAQGVINCIDTAATSPRCSLTARTSPNTQPMTPTRPLMARSTTTPGWRHRRTRNSIHANRWPAPRVRARPSGTAACAATPCCP